MAPGKVSIIVNVVVLLLKCSSTKYLLLVQQEYNTVLFRRRNEKKEPLSVVRKRTYTYEKILYLGPDFTLLYYLHAFVNW